MKLQTARVASFADGMLDAAAVASDFSPKQCALLENFRPDYDGAAKVRGGYRRFTAAHLAGVNGIDGDNSCVWGFETAAGARQLIAFVIHDSLDGQFYYSADDGVSWTLIDSGYDITAVWDHALMRVGASNYLLLVNGTDARKWDGASLSAISNIPSGAARIAFANERAWVATATDHFVYGCKIHNPEVWDDPDGLVLQIGDASPVTALAEGPTGALLVFKRDSTSVVDGYGESTLIVASGSRGVSRSVGCIGFRTVQPVNGGGMCWLSERGIEYYGGEGITLIAQGIRQYVQTQSLTAINSTNTSAWFYPLRNEYHLGFPTNEGAVVNLNTGASWLYSYSVSIVNKPVMVTIARLGDTYQPVGMTIGGHPLLLETGIEDYADLNGENGTDISARIDSALYDLGQPNRRKWWRIFRISVVPLLGEDRTVVTGLVVDGVANATTHSLQFTYSTGERPTTKRVLVSGRGNNGQIRLTCGGGVKVTGFELEGEVQRGTR